MLRSVSSLPEPGGLGPNGSRLPINTSRHAEPRVHRNNPDTQTDTDGFTYLQTGFATSEKHEDDNDAAPFREIVDPDNYASAAVRTPDVILVARPYASTTNKHCGLQGFKSDVNAVIGNLEDECLAIVADAKDPTTSPVCAPLS